MSGLAIAAIDWADIGSGIGACVAYVALSVTILILGYVLTDLTTPGKLSSLIYDDRNPNAAIIASSNLFAVGIVVTMAIWTTNAAFGVGIVTTAVFGLVGVVLLAITDLIVDRLTPGEMPSLVTDVKFHPAAAFVGVAHLVVGILIAASIA